MPSEPRAKRAHGVRSSIPLIVLNLAYAAILVVLAVAPSVPDPGIGVSDSVVHAAVYGVQALLLFVMLNTMLSAITALGLAWIGATTFGLVTEALQLIRPERSTEFKDVIANAIGAGIVVAVIVVLRHWRRRVDTQ